MTKIASRSITKHIRAWIAKPLFSALFVCTVNLVQAAQAQHSPSQTLRIIDTERALVFDASTQSGTVRVLNVRNGISEIARLRPSKMQAGTLRAQTISSISLDITQHTLSVNTPHAHYVYDTFSFRLLTPKTLVAKRSRQ